MDVSAEFPVVNQLIHLNHAAVGPWPRGTAEVVKRFAEDNAANGSLHYAEWLQQEQQLRDRLARLINAASADQIALVKNTSEGLSFVAYGIAWQAGDNIVGIRQEFPSNRFAWDSLSSQGVEFRKLDLSACEDIEQALFDLCDKHTRLITLSAVQYASGLRMDLPRVGEFCRDRDILLCVDAIQQIGALPFDVQAIGADFVVADGHKWMLAAEGLGLLYVNPDIMQDLKLYQYGWHMAENMADYKQQDFRPAATARRFECGSPNMLGIHALNASVELLLQTGLDKIGSRVLDNSRYLIEQLSRLPQVQLLSQTTDERLSGIVSFHSERIDDEKLYRYLMRHKVLCASRGGVRLSPHFYTPREQLDQALELISQAG
ncbi:MAG: aminotransferase class V-fold PLP-dependent enzyme [Gammaproteobacteria bacterium]|nr:aminotransferase class V-fold PLP-dependent enzyme [Gammaproteobacteria bacterium]